MSYRLLAACVMSTLLCPPDVAAAQEGLRGSANARSLVAPETQAAIDRGLAWLATSQNEDGSFGTSTMGRNVGVVSLCGIAFLAGGNTPGRGTYGGHLDKTLGFILSAAQPNGFVNVRASESHGPMYDHGFGTLFLAEACGMDGREDIREKLAAAVKLIVKTQNAEGGWRYQPEPKDADISVTVCQIMALRAARNCGVYVPKQTVDRCIEYLKQCQNTDGGFRYQLVRQAPSMFPRSAAAVVGLYCAGVYEGREIERGLDYVMRFRPRGDVFRHEMHYLYGHYYAVQAMWQAGEDYWTRWYPAIRDELLAGQRPDGSWRSDSLGAEYGTAMSCIILQVPNNYLPIFER